MRQIVLYWRPKLLAVLIVYFCSLGTFIGCPDPRYRLLFGEENNRTNIFRLKSDRSPVEVKMFGSGSYFGDLEVGLDLDIWKLNPSATLEIRYDSIHVLFRGTSMTLKDRRITKVELTGSQRHKFYSLYSCPVASDSLPRSVDGKSYDIPIKVVLSGAIFVNGQPISMDTVLAHVRKGYLP